MTIAADFDGTISEHTYELREFMNALSLAGHRLMVVSGRKTSEPIKDFLSQNGFPEMDIVTKEGDTSTTRTFKSKVLADNGVDVFFENDENLSLPQNHPTKVLTFQQRSLKFGRINM